MDFFSSNFQSWDPNTVWTNFRPRFQSLNLVRLRASRRALVFCVSFLKKEKEDKKSLSNRNSIYFVFYPCFLSRGCRQASLPSAERQPSLFEFWRSCWISFFFASYFVLHNNYFRILAIHRYKSSWRCSHNYLKRKR